MADYKAAAAELLKSHDDFLRAAPMDDESLERSKAVSRAISFAVEAYDRGHGHQAMHAMGRAFLLALIDPAHPDLDYLRADPKSGEIARLMNADLQTIVQSKGQSDGR